MKSKKKREHKFNFREEYKLSFDYLRESKNFIYFSIGLFLVFSLIGFFVPVPESIKVKILEMIQELLQQTEGLGWGGLISFIFSNNIQSSFFSMVFGVFLGILPILSAMFNGYLLGFVLAMVIKTEGIFSFWRLLPHGIFELPAIFISFGLGIKFGTFIFWKKRVEKFQEYFWNSLRVFLFVILPLLILAAIIEGTLIFLGS